MESTILAPYGMYLLKTKIYIQLKLSKTKNLEAQAK